MKNEAQNWRNYEGCITALLRSFSDYYRKGFRNVLNKYVLKIEIWQIHDISPLAHLEQFKEFHLYYNHIHDLRPLAHLQQLEYLNLEHNNIQDISALGQLKNLYGLKLGHNPITDFKPLAKLKKLDFIYLDENQMRQIGAEFIKVSSGGAQYRSPILPGVQIIGTP